VVGAGLLALVDVEEGRRAAARVDAAVRAREGRG